MKGNNIILYKIKFESFMKWNIYISLSVGILFGILMLLISFIGGDVNANLGQNQFNGITAGIIGLIISPFIFLLFGIITSFLLFLPFKAALKLRKGIRLNGLFELIEINTEPTDNIKNDDKDVNVNDENKEDEDIPKR